jgi:hypothetical protein
MINELPLELENIRKQVEELWLVHLATKFPKGYGGEEIERIDLALLDATVAGCISTYLKRKRTLDKHRLAILGRCYHNLAVVIRHLEGEAQQYFVRLETLADLVLWDIVISTRKP